MRCGRWCFKQLTYSTHGTDTHNLFIYLYKLSKSSLLSLTKMINKAPVILISTIISILSKKNNINLNKGCIKHTKRHINKDISIKKIITIFTNNKQSFYYYYYKARGYTVSNPVHALHVWNDKNKNSTYVILYYNIYKLWANNNTTQKNISVQIYAYILWFPCSCPIGAYPNLCNFGHDWVTEARAENADRKAAR